MQLILRILRSIIVCIGLSWTLGAAGKPFTVKAAGITKLAFGDRWPSDIVIEIETKTQTITDAEEEIYDRARTYHFGIGKSNVVITSMKLTWGPLPPEYLVASAFADLRNPVKIEMDFKGASILLLNISGGSESGLYRAMLEIAPHGVIKRSVYSKKTGYEETALYTHPPYIVEYVRNELKDLMEKASREAAGKSENEPKGPGSH